jgi:hypothetical protein
MEVKHTLGAVCFELEASYPQTVWTNSFSACDEIGRAVFRQFWQNFREPADIDGLPTNFVITVHWVVSEQ